MSFEMTTLGEYISIQGGYAYKSQQFIDKSLYPVLKIKNIRTGYVDFEDCAYIGKEIAEETERYIVSEGDILISLTGSGPNAPQSLVGRVARFWNKGNRAWINQRVGKIVLKAERNIHKDFVFYFLATKESQNYLVANSSGSANQANINGKTIEALPFPKVEYLTSKKIAYILRTIDEKIHLNNQINQTLESIAQAIFKSWFIDFEPVKAKIFAKQASKDPELAAMCAISGKSEAELEQMAQEDFRELQATAALFPDEFIDSELQGIPKGWKSTDISNVTTSIFSGGTPATKEPSFWNGEIPWLSSGETRNKIIVSTEKFITKIGVRDSSTKLSTYGDVLIASAGQGHTRGQTSFNAIECYINQSIVALRANDKISPYWLYYCLEPRYDEMRSLSDSHSSRGSLTTKLLASMPVILPTHELIDNFDKVVKSMVVKRIKNLREIKVLADIRDSLLPKLLSGEIDVSALQGVMHD
ncbi:restriction endonuclease subunit S [Acinetobacter baumannii]|nr:restriction endonuclease subunit S [Acinetobacter baumannii]